MTLVQLLGINPRLLDSDEAEGLRLAERLFSEAGAPIDRRALYVVLEKIIDQIHRKRERGSSIRYPRFLYGKFKALKSGLWEPKAPTVAQIEQEERELRSEAATLSTQRVREALEMLVAAQKAGDPKAIAHWQEQVKEREAAATAEKNQQQSQPRRPQLVPDKRTA